MPIASPKLMRSYYGNTAEAFLRDSDELVLGILTRHSEFAVEETQRIAWLEEMTLLRRYMPSLTSEFGESEIYFEFSIPRMGKRIDVVVLIGGIVFVLEFKVGERQFPLHAIDQVVDYALDLKNFHEGSHRAVIAPVLIATQAPLAVAGAIEASKNDQVLKPLCSTADGLGAVMRAVLSAKASRTSPLTDWNLSRYCPTPTIIEAATALYCGHHVEEISRSDAGATNLAHTSLCIEQVISQCCARREKAICFVTGVPGAGKTLVGLNIATRPKSEHHSVFLSGNGPLVKILHEALARDSIARKAASGTRQKLGEARSEVKAFIQNVHHFRDDCLRDASRPPIEHVALFDEAQRAWNLKQTAFFMERKKGHVGFAQSEPDFLISCMDRHPDWAVIVCLVGGGQEINTGEAGINGWLDAVRDKFPSWQVYASPQLHEKEYQANENMQRLHAHGRAHFRTELHLSSSMRSYRAEHVSAWVKAVLDGDVANARVLYGEFADRYPIVLTRSIEAGKAWTRAQARGSERYGLIVSSQAQPKHGDSPLPILLNSRVIPHEYRPQFGF